MATLNKIVDSRITYLTITILLWVLVAYKATIMSMTHDESSSFYHLSNQNIYTHLFDKSKWGNANNHWLNTLSFQFFTSIFGPQEWAIRLFNILMFGVYAHFLYLLLLDINNKYLVFASFLFGVANLYVLDFFSTARGYGLSLGFTTAGIYYASQYLKLENIKFLLFCLFMLLLASLSLFASAIYFPSVLGSLFCILLIINKYQFAKIIKPIMITGAMGLLAIALLYIPITTLSKNAEFKWGLPNLIESFQSLVFHTSYGAKYAPPESFLTGFMAAFLFYCVLKIGLKLYLNKNWSNYQSLVLVTLSFIFILLIMIAARHFTDTYYPSDRKTVMYIPFLAFIFFGSIDLNNSEKLKTMFGVIATMVFIVHFLHQYHIKSVREWWYDENTKEFAQRCVQDFGKPNPSVACHWYYHPTLSFYNLTKYNNSIKVHQYNKNIDTSQVYDYYLCFDSELQSLSSRYNIFHKNINGRYILKRK